MQSKLKTVDLYMETVPEERKAALANLRKHCRKYLKSHEEAMEYGIPSYKRNGIVEVAFNSQKHFIALYILKKAVLDQYREVLNGLSVGKGCIRYSKPEKINFDLVKEMLVATQNSKEPICPR